MNLLTLTKTSVVSNYCPKCRTKQRPSILLWGISIKIKEKSWIQNSAMFPRAGTLEIKQKLYMQQYEINPVL